MGTSSFCITGKKIPNVVGFGTFPNVVGFPSFQTVPRIEAALHGGLNCAVYGGGLDCALYRKPQTAPWVASWTPCLGTRLGSPLGCALACSLDCFALGRGESSLGPFLGTSSFCITGKKIPNVVGFGTFPNVVGFPSLQTVPRIEAALHGNLNCAVYGGGLDCALYRKAQTAPRVASWTPCLGTRLGSPLGRALACSLDCFALGRAWGESSLGPFLGTSSFCLTGKKIPNVVGFGTFPNVVGFPSLRTVPRIEAALQGAFNCAFRPWLRLA